MTKRGAELLLVGVTILWGATFAFIKNEMVDTQPSVFVALRFGIASLLGLLLWHGNLRRLDARTRRRGVVLGLLYGTGFLLQTVGMQHTTASASAFVTGTMVVFVPIVNRLLHGTPVKPNHLASIVLVLVGLWFFTNPQEHGVNLGDAITLLSSIFWAVYLTYIDVWTREIQDDASSLNALVVLQFIVTVVLALVMVGVDAANGHAVLPTFDTQFVVALAYCAVLASLVATFVQTRYQHYTHPVRAGVIYALEPLAAAAIAWIILDERFSPMQIVGASVLLIGTVVPDLVVASIQRRTEQTPTTREQDV